MHEEPTILHDEAEAVREIQQCIRRQLDKRGRPTLKMIASDSGLRYDTLLTYLPNPEGSKKPIALTVAGLRLLCGALPPELLSMLLPDGFQIVRAPESIDHDALCDLAENYVAEKVAAHRADSECGVEIGPREKDRLDGKVVQLRGEAAA